MTTVPDGTDEVNDEEQEVGGADGPHRQQHHGEHLDL